MNRSAPRTARRALEHGVHLALFAGLLASGALLVAGLVVGLATHDVGPESPPPGLFTLIADAVGGHAVALIDLGVLVLMATPALRVVVLFSGWWLARERRFALVAASVLALLVASVFLGAR